MPNPSMIFLPTDNDSSAAGLLSILHLPSPRGHRGRRQTPPVRRRRPRHAYTLADLSPQAPHLQHAALLAGGFHILLALMLIFPTFVTPVPIQESTLTVSLDSPFPTESFETNQTQPIQLTEEVVSQEEAEEVQKEVHLLEEPVIPTRDPINPSTPVPPVFPQPAPAPPTQQDSSTDQPPPSIQGTTTSTNGSETSPPSPPASPETFHRTPPSNPFPFAPQPSEDPFPIIPPTKPIIIKSPRYYPPSVRGQNLSGEVTLLIQINDKGTIDWATIHQPSNTPSLNQAALESVKDYVFEPATNAGIPISSFARLTIVFNLYQ